MFATRLEAALRVLQQAGIWRLNFAPPIYLILWKLGVQVPPPHFRSFGWNFMLNGAYFGLVWGGLVMWIGEWSMHQAIPMAGIAGALFGLGMASYYRHGQIKHRLPQWDSLSEGSA